MELEEFKKLKPYDRVRIKTVEENIDIIPTTFSLRFAGCVVRIKEIHGEYFTICNVASDCKMHCGLIRNKEEEYKYIYFVKMINGSTVQTKYYKRYKDAIEDYDFLVKVLKNNKDETFVRELHYEGFIVNPIRKEYQTTDFKIVLDEDILHEDGEKYFDTDWYRHNWGIE